MRHKSLLFRLVSLCTGIGIAGLLAGCASVTPSTEEVAPPTATGEVALPTATGEVASPTWCPLPYAPVPAPLKVEKLGEAIVSEIGNYIEGQIILAGLGTDIDDVAGSFGLEPENMAASTGPDLDDKAPSIPAKDGPFAGLDSTTWPIPDLQYANFEYRLYTYNPADYPEYPTLRDFIRAIYDWQKESDGGIRVFADANYLVTSPSSDPRVMQGSPWGVEISPWGVQISTPAGTGTQVTAQEVFWSQWALHEEPGGINLLTGPDPYGRPAGVGMGDRIDIAVFDTSPYEPGFYQLDTYQGKLSLELCVSHITPVVPLPPPPRGSVASNINNHGLFVAGLAHAVAPSSRISLVKVLDGSAQGDLFTLIDGLRWYMARHVGQAPNDSGTLNHTVINLSLGFVPDPTDPFPHASQVVFWNVRDQGAVVVAAAGNHSAGISPPLNPEYPAAWEEVIGVGASNRSGGQSCYANNSDDVYAPGGEGAPGCMPGWKSCAPDDPYCEAGVISLVSNGQTPPGVSYAFWSGSSFSTPMISGLAALLLEAGKDPTQFLIRPTTGGLLIPNVGKMVP